MRSLKFLIAYVVGVIRDPGVRRQCMFYGVIVALVLLFAGSTFLDVSYPRRSRVFFAGYWLACAWVTVAVLLLALYDMVSVRAAARRERRRLEKEHLARQRSAQEPDDENPA